MCNTLRVNAIRKTKAAPIEKTADESVRLIQLNPCWTNAPVLAPRAVRPHSLTTSSNSWSSSTRRGRGHSVLSGRVRHAPRPLGRTEAMTESVPLLAGANLNEGRIIVLPRG